MAVASASHVYEIDPGAIPISSKKVWGPATLTLAFDVSKQANIVYWA
jgi:hypothetical protein